MRPERNSLRLMAEGVRWANEAHGSTRSVAGIIITPLANDELPWSAWPQLLAHGRSLGGRARRHTRRGRKRRRAAHGLRWGVHYREQLPYGWGVTAATPGPIPKSGSTGASGLLQLTPTRHALGTPAICRLRVEPPKGMLLAEGIRSRDPRRLP